MKTRILKLSCLALMLFTFFGCNDCSECEKENKILKEQLELNNSDDENNQNNESINTQSSLNKYGVKGYFSLKQKNLFVIIPVTDNSLKYKDAFNISSGDTNAVLIQIDSEENDTCSPESPVSDLITKTLSFDELKLDKEELEKDGNLMIIVINSDGTDLGDYIKEYKTRVKTHKYKIKDCLINNCKKIQELSELKRKDIKPNEDGGDIIIGG